ncbi:MAG: PAS domain-containing protein, partial [Nannocystaceae bacterium]
PAYERLLGVGPGELLGKTDHEIFGEKAGQQNRANDLKVCEDGQAQSIEEVIPHPDGDMTYMSLKFPLYDPQGEVRGVAGIANDITELREAERERATLQEKVIRGQQRTLSEISTPVLPLAEGVIALPLIGAINSGRAEALLDALLTGITDNGAHLAIVDITGVRSIDKTVAAAILQASKAARLLGTRVIITGVHPDVAQTLVAIGADWSGVETLRTLRDGVAAAISS